MRSNICTIILIAILFSCKNVKEEKTVKSDVVFKDTLKEIQKSEIPINEEKGFVNDFDILLPDTYETHANVNLAASLNEKWIDLYQKDGEYYLGVPKFKIEKGISDSSGFPLMSIMSENETLIFMDFPEFKTGKIKHLNISKRKIWPNDKLTFSFNNVDYVLRAEGKVLSEAKTVTEEDDKEAIFNEIADFKLYLTAGNIAEQLIFEEESFWENVLELLFVGDIDGDGKLDFLLKADRNNEDNRVVLFLSSKAENTEAVKKVSEIEWYLE
ncbi:FG-GAP repeat protein [Flavobacterium hungaricum]|uniref:Lipoprotein n=1 Tax=Flavobacterium hungaricum TaxID=2082725 RepID=A0ABR9TP11_9FLAO|nr:FG-GAP repeat protein [Flavobacterium hungaricum]MBE8727113.1 hypothetical protein [Flavobacterium hungaricum]